MKNKDVKVLCLKDIEYLFFQLVKMQKKIAVSEIKLLLANLFNIKRVETHIFNYLSKTFGVLDTNLEYLLLNEINHFQDLNQNNTKSIPK